MWDMFSDREDVIARIECDIHSIQHRYDIKTEEDKLDYLNGMLEEYEWYLQWQFYLLTQYQMTDLKNYIRHRNYLWGICSMTGYQPENEDFYYKLTVENAKQQFEKEKQLYGEDKKKWLALYKYRTELEMFINWR